MVALKGAILFIALKRAVLSVRMPGLPAELPKAQPSVSVDVLCAFLGREVKFMFLCHLGSIVEG